MSSGNEGTVTDIDGNIYKTVKIGEQWWMAENLKVTHFRNGDVIPNVTDNTEWSHLFTSAYCIYINDDKYADTCGCLYNWYAVNDSRNIAPAGWHVPSDDEWKQLEMFLGMSQSDVEQTSWRGTDEGTKMKSTSGWSNDGNGSDDYGFSALPWSYRFFNGYFSTLGAYTYFWSSAVYNIDTAWSRKLHCDYSDVYRKRITKQLGFSVRLVRD